MLDAFGSPVCFPGNPRLVTTLCYNDTSDICPYSLKQASWGVLPLQFGTCTLGPDESLDLSNFHEVLKSNPAGEAISLAPSCRPQRGALTALRHTEVSIALAP